MTDSLTLFKVKLDSHGLNVHRCVVRQLATTFETHSQQRVFEVEMSIKRAHSTIADLKDASLKPPNQVLAGPVEGMSVHSLVENCAPVSHSLYW